MNTLRNAAQEARQKISSQFKILCVATFMLVAAFILFANQYAYASSTGDFTIEDQGGVKVLTAYTGSSQEVVIPDGVQKIGERAFYDKGITQVTVPDSVTTIAGHAFQNNNLTKLTLPAVTTVGEYAFSTNTLSSLTAPALTTVGDYAFADNDLTTYSQSSGSIGVAAFRNNKLSSLSVSELTGEIKDNAFSGNRLKKVALSNTVKLGNNVFGNNGQWVILTTENPAITSAKSPDGFGQIVNPAKLVVHFVDKATKKTIMADREVGTDPTQDMFSVGETFTYTVPKITNYSYPQATVQVQITSAVTELTLEYEKSSILPVIELKKPIEKSPDLIVFAPNAAADKTVLLGLVTAHDFKGKDISSKVTVAPESVDTSTNHTEKIVYSVTDDYNNTNTHEFTVMVGTNWPDFELGEGWTLGDFEYYGDSVLGLSRAEGKGVNKLAAHPHLILPHINPYTLQPITDIASKALQAYSGPIEGYMLENVKAAGLPFTDYGQLWRVHQTDWDGAREGKGFGTLPPNQKTDGTNLDITTANVLPFGDIDNRLVYTISFYPGSQIKTISSEAFCTFSGFKYYADCRVYGSSLEQVDFTNIKDTLEDIGTYAFRYSNLQSVNLDGCPNLKIIRDRAFWQTALKEINISNNPKLEEICESAFANQDQNGGTVKINNNAALRSIDEQAFIQKYYPKYFSDINISNNPSLETIGDKAFFGHKTPTYQGAFDNLPALKHIGLAAFGRTVMDSGRTEIPGGFSNDFQKENITLDAQQLSFPQSHNLDAQSFGSKVVTHAKGMDKYAGSKGNRVAIWIPEELTNVVPSKENYLINPPDPATIPESSAPANWNSNDFVYTESDDGMAIVGLSASGILKFEKGHTQLVLPDMAYNDKPVVALASGAISGKAFTSIDATHMKHLKVIKAGAFSGMGSSVTSLDFSNTPLEQIESGAFPRMSNLTTASFANTKISEIPDRLFDWAGQLTQADFSGCGNITRIGSLAFGFTSSLKTLDLSSLVNLTEIASKAFYSSAVSTIDFTKFPVLQTIGDSAFETDKHLTAPDFSNSPALTSIGDKAFKDTNIGTVNFSGATALTTIGEAAFQNAGLTELDLTNTKVAAIAKDTFVHNKLTKVYIPKTLTSIDTSTPSSNPDKGHSAFKENPGANKWNQVFLYTPDRVNNEGLAAAYSSEARIAGSQESDGWIQNPIKVTLNCIRQNKDHNGSWVNQGTVKTDEFWIGETREENTPHIHGLVAVEPTVTLEKRAKDYSIDVLYRPVNPEDLNNDFRLRHEHYSGVSRYYIGEEMLTNFYFDATGIETDETGLVIEISYDPKFLDENAIKVPPSDKIKSWHASNGTLHIELARVLGADSLKIPITWKFKKYVTPDNYQATLTAGLYNSERQVYQVANPLTLEGYYHQPQMVKLSNGDENNGTVKISPNQALDFNVLNNPSITYSARVYTPPKTSFYNEVLDRTIESYVVTDTLPHYKRAVMLDSGEPKYDENNQVVYEEVPASFDPQKNPGWKLSEDGQSVTYTKKGLNTTRVSFPALKLDFPHVLNGTTFVNDMQVTMVPHDKADSEQNMVVQDSISNQFVTEIEYIDWNGASDYDMMAIGPRYEAGRGAYFFDTAKDRKKEIPWKLHASVLKPGTDVTMSNLQLDFFDLDERLYPNAVEPTYAGTITAYDEGGSPIGDPLHVAAGEKVELREDMKQAKKLHYTMDPDVQVRRSSANLIVYTKLHDQESHVYQAEMTDKNSFRADSHCTFDKFDNQKQMQVPAFSEGSKGIASVIQFQRGLRIVKTQTYPTDSSVFQDTQGSYNLSLVRYVNGKNEHDEDNDVEEFTKPITNPVIVDVLPAHMTLESVQLSPEFSAAKGTYEVRNLGEGKTVIVFTAPSLDVYVKNIATINTSTNIEVKDGETVNNAYLSWNDDDIAIVGPKGPVLDQDGRELDIPTIFGLDHTYTEYSKDRTSFNLLKVASLEARKFIRVSENDPWKKTGVLTDPGETFQYRLALINQLDTQNPNNTRKNIEFYDVLPFVGDKGITTNDTRDSQFEDKVLGAEIPEGYELFYTTDEIDVSHFTNQDTADAYLPTLNWVKAENPADLSGVTGQITAIHVRALEGTTLAPGNTLNVILNMQAPQLQEVNDRGLIGKRAWNSFVRKDDSAIRFIEPNKVYNEIRRPDSVITLKKVEKTRPGSPEVVLEGVVFRLYDTDGRFIDEQTTDHEGMATFRNVDSNKNYVLREVSAPKGADGKTYKLIDPITITKEDLVNANYNYDLGTIENSVTIERIKPVTGRIMVKKVNGQGQPISGVKFKLTSVDKVVPAMPDYKPEWPLNENNQIEMYAYSMSDGYATFENLPMGYYNIEEVQGESHFYGTWKTKEPVRLKNDPKSDAVPTVVIDGENSVVNNKGTVKLYKLGILNEEKAAIPWEDLQRIDGVLLPGTKFTITKQGSDEVAFEGTTNSQGYLQVTGLDLDTMYEVHEIAAPDAYTPAEGTYTFQIDHTGRLLKADGEPFKYDALYIPNKKKEFESSATIKKVDQYGTVVPGAHFTIYKKSDGGTYEPYTNKDIEAAQALLDTATTGELGTGELVSDEQGVVQFTGLVGGEYQIKETKAPEGYLKSPEVYTFVADKNVHKDFTYTAVNKKLDLEVAKYELILPSATQEEAQKFVQEHPEENYVVKGGTGGIYSVIKPLPGAKFALYEVTQGDDDQPQLNFIMEVATGKNGIAHFDYAPKPDAIYHVVETQAPTGYALNTNPYIVKFSDYEQDENFTGKIQISAENRHARGQISLSKYGRTLGKTLEGTEFTLYKLEDGQEVQVGEPQATNKYGMVVFKDLDLGYEYVLKETKTTGDFSLLKEPIKVGALTEEVPTVSVVAYNSGLNITFTKTDPVLKPLPGATFSLYEDATCQTVVDTQVSGENGKFTFGNLSKGTYYLKETAAPEGYEPNNNVYTITVTGDEEFTTRTTEGDTIAANRIINIPKKEIEVVLKAHKLLKGKDLQAGDFTFVLEQDGKEIARANNAQDGTVTFPAQHYTEPGTYTYTMREIAGSDSAMTYDTAAQTVTVTITRDAQGDLQQAVDYGPAHGTFTNTYHHPKEAHVKFKFDKQLQGRALKDKEFTFVLKEGDAELARVTNDAQGKVEFPTLTYTEPGTHTYTVEEVKGSDKTVAYDTEKRTIEVTVSLNEQNELVANITKETGSKIFTNVVHNPHKPSLVLKFKKVLEGQDLKAGEFAFTLTENGRELSRTTNTAAGDVIFPALTYTEPGTHTYTVAEVAGTDTNVTYDTAVRTVVVEVALNKNHELEAKVTKVEGDTTFTNKVTPPHTPPETPPSTPPTTPPSNPPHLIPKTSDVSWVRGGTLAALLGGALLLSAAWLTRKTWSK